MVPTSPLTPWLADLHARYLQMSGMVLGSMIEADYRLRQYEARVRMQRRVMKDRARWQRFEEEFAKDDEEK
jgi:hypothetical protein